MRNYGKYVDAVAILVAARTKVWVYGRSFVGNAGCNCGLESRLGQSCQSLVSVLCCNVGVPVSNR
jgi:hypothetical protein